MKYTGDALCFDDILLTPGLSDVSSRSKVDLRMDTADIHGGKCLSLNLPVFAAPMDTVTGFDMVLAMGEAGGMAVLPRTEHQKHVHKQLTTALKFYYFFYSVGSGVGMEDLEEIEYFGNSGHRYICVDVAHGGNEKTARKVETIKDMIPGAFVMSGNVATPEEFRRLSDAGADLIRVGIGGGSACTTRIQTGHGVPTLQSLMDISFMRKADDAAIIADGGIRNAGDAAKAFAAGARFVMVGGMLAGTSNAPDVRDESGNRIFRGMASSAFTTNVEGVSHIIDDKGDTQDVLRNLKNGLASACSYSGVHRLSELAEAAEYKVVTPQGVRENGAHHNRK